MIRKLVKDEALNKVMEEKLVMMNGLYFRINTIKVDNVEDAK